MIMIPANVDEKIKVRSAQEKDRHQIANLIHFEPYTHRHLDWRPPLDWIGHKPYLVAESQRQIIGALACPLDPQDVAWIRLFAVAGQYDVNQVWVQLWEECMKTLTELKPKVVAAIPMQNWFQEILDSFDFTKSNDVIMLTRELDELPKKRGNHDEIIIRMMNIDDIEKVCRVDQVAFDPIWRNSKEALEFAYQQSALATVAENKDYGILGYTISTVSPVGGHLARLAVHPDFQSSGIGYKLTLDVLKQFQKRGSSQVSVNTQLNNNASLSLYKRLGFTKTGEILPVFQCTLR